MRTLRNLSLLAVSAALSYYLLLHRPARPPAPQPPPVKTADLAVVPRPAPSPPAPLPPPAAANAPPAEAAPAPAERPPPESGTPEGEPEVNGGDPRRDAERIRDEIGALAREKELVKRAEAEVTGEARRGFKTVFLCAARDQVAVARTFGESLVLVPRNGLDPKRPHYYRLREGAEIEEVKERPPLERFRQYRNLFAFPYDDLPPALRRLRRAVPNRGDIYLFAALIPASEWAVVITRRAAALADANRPLDDVRRVTMRYVALPGGGFDIRVAEIRFTDGTRWTGAGSS